MRTTRYSLQHRHGGTTDGDQAWVEIAGTETSTSARAGLQLAALLELGTKLAATSYQADYPAAQTLRVVESTTASGIDGGDTEPEVVWFAGSRNHAHQDIA